MEDGAHQNQLTLDVSAEDAKATEDLIWCSSLISCHGLEVKVAAYHRALTVQGLLRSATDYLHTGDTELTGDLREGEGDASMHDEVLGVGALEDNVALDIDALGVDGDLPPFGMTF
jgi:hypothetical protein